jgi:hypothetical protein
MLDCQPMSEQPPPNQQHQRENHQHHDALLYQQWVELMDELGQYAVERGLRLDKESDFTGYIYRMERAYSLPTTVQAVSIGLASGKAVLLASVSPPIEPLKGIHLRIMGGHQSWHLHAGPDGLMQGQLRLTRERLHSILDRVFAIKA